MKRLMKALFILALIFCFAMPAFAIKILPYNVPLQDLMKWDKSGATLRISNPEGETLSVAWASTVDLWNYDGATWTFDLPAGDTFAFGKGVAVTGVSSITGATTITGAVTITGALNVASFFDMGTADVGIAVTTASPFTVEIHTEPLTTLTAGDTGLSCGLRSRYHVSVAQANAISIGAIDARLRVKHALANGLHYGINAGIEASTANADFTGTATTQRCAGHFYIEADADVTFVDDGWLTGITIDSSVHGDVSMAAVQFAGLRIKTSSAKEEWEQGIYITGSVVGIDIGACTTGISFTGACTTAAISMDGATFAAGDNEIEMRNNVAGDKTIIASGAATDDAGIVTAVGADADIADGSLYMSCTDGAGVLFIKKNDVWTAFTNP